MQTTTNALLSAHGNLPQRRRHEATDKARTGGDSACGTGNSVHTQGTRAATGRTARPDMPAAADDVQIALWTAGRISIKVCAPCN